MEHRAVCVSNRLGRWFSSLSFLCSPASLAITVWMEYSSEAFVSPVNATAMQLSVIFKAFAWWVLPKPWTPHSYPPYYSHLLSRSDFLKMWFLHRRTFLPLKPQRKFAYFSSCHKIFPACHIFFEKYVILVIVKKGYMISL